MNFEATSPDQGRTPQLALATGQAEIDRTAALLRLLQLEADIRRIETPRELVFHLANESRGVLGFRQCFVFRRRRGWLLEAVSSVNAFDPNAALNQDLTRLVRMLTAQGGGTETQRLRLPGDTESDVLRDYAFPQAMWLPIRTRRGKVVAGCLLLRESEWPEPVIPLAERVMQTYSHAWEALAGRKLERTFSVPRGLVFAALVAAVVAMSILKTPLSVLAPAEITGQNRTAVAAALNGVVEDVLVAPNTIVEEGVLLARYDDTELRNALEIADRETIVARTQLEKLQNASFSDRAAARELKVAEAELALAEAESELAHDRLGRVEIRASRAGLVAFNDPRDLIGRPVSVGERLMEIIDPGDLEVSIRLPVDDSIVLNKGARVRIFLDSDPLSPIEAELTRLSYRATTHDDGSFAYSLTATAAREALDETRLGAQGTAQLFGARHSLLFIAFRRPLSWLRQTFGV